MEMNAEQKIRGGVKRRKCSTSDVSFTNIPEELQIEIISWLPPESLSRCKCVSKHWNDTLTIQAFWFRHSRSYDKHPKLAFAVTSNDWVVSFELNDDNTPKTTESRIRGKHVYFTDFLMCNYPYMSNICNNLICLFDESSSRVGLLSVRSRDFIQLPAVNTNLNPSRYWYALGFDPVHKVFKVLSITYEWTGERHTAKAAILTIGSKYWKQIDFNCLPSSVTKRPSRQSIISSICLDGVIYWAPDCTSVLTVVAFDLNHETFRDNKLITTSIKNGMFEYYLTSVKGCLTMLIWKVGSDEIQQWTLFNHKNPNAAWNYKNFTSHNFLNGCPYDYSNWISVTGDNFLLRQVSLAQYLLLLNRDLVKPQEHYDSECSYLLYDLYKFAIEME